MSGDSIISLFFYLATFFTSAVLIYLGEKHRRKLLTVLGLSVPILTATFRYNTGIDFANYVDISKVISPLSLSEFFNSSYLAVYEPTLFAFARLSQTLTNTDILMFLIYSIISILPFYFAVRRINKNFSYLAILFYLLVFFAPSLNLVRQYAAISIVFYATILYIYRTNIAFRHRLAVFVFLVLLATLVHASAICALILPIVYWFSQKFVHKTPLQTTLYFTLLSIIGLTVITPILLNIDSIPLLNKYTYALKMDTEGAPIPNPIPKLVPVVVGAIFIGRSLISDKRNLFYYLMAYIAFATSLFGYIIPYGYRLSDYFFIFQVPLFINIVSTAHPTKRRNLYIVFLVIYAVIYFLYSSFLNNSHGIFPYQSILF